MQEVKVIQLRGQESSVPGKRCASGIGIKIPCEGLPEERELLGRGEGVQGRE